MERGDSCITWVRRDAQRVLGDLEGPDGVPAARWGLCDRDGSRLVPSEEVMRTLAAAARADLAQDPATRASRALGAGLVLVGASV